MYEHVRVQIERKDVAGDQEQVPIYVTAASDSVSTHGMGVELLERRDRVRPAWGRRLALARRHRRRRSAFSHISPMMQRPGVAAYEHRDVRGGRCKPCGRSVFVATLALYGDRAVTQQHTESQEAQSNRAASRS